MAAEICVIFGRTATRSINCLLGLFLLLEANRGLLGRGDVSVF